MLDIIKPTTYEFEIDDALDSLDLLKPNIVTPLPMQQSGKAGSTIRLLCLLTGYPPLQIEWYLNGELISSLNDQRFSFENNTRALVIKDLKTQDSGSISFHAKNKYGEISNTCYLKVEGKSSKKTKALSMLPMKKKLTMVMNKGR